MKNLDFKKAGVRRDCIGKKIFWCKYNSMYLPSRHHPDGTGILLKTSGRNILVDQNGSTDWLWVPDLTAVWLDEDFEIKGAV